MRVWVEKSVGKYAFSDAITSEFQDQKRNFGIGRGYSEKSERECGNYVVGSATGSISATGKALSDPAVECPLRWRRPRET